MPETTKKRQLGLDLCESFGHIARSVRSAVASLGVKRGLQA